MFSPVFSFEAGSSGERSVGDEWSTGPGWVWRRHETKAVTGGRVPETRRLINAKRPCPRRQIRGTSLLQERRALETESSRKRWCAKREVGSGWVSWSSSSSSSSNDGVGVVVIIVGDSGGDNKNDGTRAMEEKVRERWITGSERTERMNVPAHRRGSGLEQLSVQFHPGRRPEGLMCQGAGLARRGEGGTSGWWW